MKKVLFLIAVLTVCLAASAMAQVPSGYIPSGWYTYEFSDTFDGYAVPGPTPGTVDIAGLGGWVKGSTATQSGKVVDKVAESLSPDHYYQQVASVKSQAVRNMKGLNSGNKTYKVGAITAWVYDPKLPSSSTTDTRVGFTSDITPMGSDIAKNITANITSGSGLTGDYNYWRGQWSYSAFSLDGVTTPAGGAGYTFTIGPAAPRVLGWSFAMLTWNFTYVNVPGQAPKASALHVEYFINPKFDGSDVANMALDVTTASTRWANSANVGGMVMGSYNTSCTKPGRIDSVYFGGEVVPEPAGLMALGTGMIGLLGLIRRRK